MASAAVVGILASVTGCTETEEPRPRFANDPIPTREQPPFLPTLDTTASPVMPPALSTPVRLDPAQLLRARGAPRHIYFTSDQALWVLDSESESADELWSADKGAAIQSVAASPAGDFVALLIEPNSGSAEREIVLLDASGAEQMRAENLAAPLGVDEATATAIDWSPQGDQLLITFDPGGIVGMPVDGEGEPRLIVAAEQAISPLEAKWSPTGEAVAYVATGAESELAELFIAGATASPPASGPTVVPIDAGRGVRGLAWTPDGRELLIVQGDSAGIGGGGDLWRIAPDGSQRALVASAGTAAPVGRVGIFRPSPAGDAVAYTVEAPSTDGATFHSLWVRQMSSDPGTAIQINVPEGERVTTIWWSQSGFLFATSSDLAESGEERSPELSIYRAVANGDPQLLLRIGSERGTPVASGSPAAAEAEASPIAANGDATSDNRSD